MKKIIAVAVTGALLAGSVFAFDTVAADAAVVANEKAAANAVVIEDAAALTEDDLFADINAVALTKEETSKIEGGQVIGPRIPVETILKEAGKILKRIFGW